MSGSCTGQWTGSGSCEESSPWWEDDVRSSNARLDLLDLLRSGTSSGAERWRAHIGVDRRPAVPRHATSGTCWHRPRVRRRPGRQRPGWPPCGAWTDADVWTTSCGGSVAHGRPGRGRCRCRGSARADRTAAETISDHRRRRRAGSAATAALGETWPLDLAAQLDRFHGRDARPALEAALAGWERIGHVPDVAVTHLSLAEAHALHGDREAARRHLSAGREIAARLEARPMLARADALADRYALASRERRTTDVLTDREAEVLALLAEGRTNAEIAATLFMSPKTASVHVSHIIAKLGAGNRTEAAATARRQGLLQ